MRITDVLKTDSIKVFLEGKDKTAVMRELLDLALRGREPKEKEEILLDLYAREKDNSTGIGDGIAIPHGYAVENKLIAALGLAKEPLDFDALDGQPVRLVLLVLASRQKTGLKLRFLARLSRLFHDRGLKEKLLECTSADEVLDTFSRYEDLHFG